MIIAFGHRKQQGKDTAAWYFSELMGDCVIRSLAGKLYEVCEILVDDFQYKDFYDKHPELKEIPLENGLTPRETLIGVGQKIKEVLGKDCWVKAALKINSNFYDLEETNVLISDLRYKEEAEVLKKHGAICVRVVRPEIEVKSDSADEDLADWDGWDYTLYNSGSLGTFRMECFNLYEKIKRDLNKGSINEQN